MQGNQGQTDDFDSTAAARNGVHGPYGPLLGELKTKVDLDLELAFRRMCAEEGTDHSAVLRNWVNEFVRGISYDAAVVHAVESRGARFARKGPDGAPTQDVAA
jgi:hypothetical protein